MIRSSRRGFLIGLAAGIAAPAIVRPGLIMPIKPSLVPVAFTGPGTFEPVRSWSFLGVIKSYDPVTGAVEAVVSRQSKDGMPLFTNGVFSTTLNKQSEFIRPGMSIMFGTMFSEANGERRWVATDPGAQWSVNLEGNEEDSGGGCDG